MEKEKYVKNQNIKYIIMLMNKFPNRVKVIRDFELILSKAEYLNFNKDDVKVVLSEDVLYSKLQKIIFNLVYENNDHKSLKKVINEDLNNNDLNFNNIYELVNYWCKLKYNVLV